LCAYRQFQTDLLQLLPDLLLRPVSARIGLLRSNHEVFASELAFVAAAKSVHDASSQQQNFIEESL